MRSQSRPQGRASGCFEPASTTLATTRRSRRPRRCGTAARRASTARRGDRRTTSRAGRAVPGWRAARGRTADPRTDEALGALRERRVPAPCLHREVLRLLGCRRCVPGTTGSAVLRPVPCARRARRPGRSGARAPRRSPPRTARTRAAPGAAPAPGPRTTTGSRSGRPPQPARARRWPRRPDRWFSAAPGASSQATDPRTAAALSTIATPAAMRAGPPARVPTTPPGPRRVPTVRGPRREDEGDERDARDGAPDDAPGTARPQDAQHGSREHHDAAAPRSVRAGAPGSRRRRSRAAPSPRRAHAAARADRARAARSRRRAAAARRPCARPRRRPPRARRARRPTGRRRVRASCAQAREAVAARPWWRLEPHAAARPYRGERRPPPRR